MEDVVRRSRLLKIAVFAREAAKQWSAHRDTFHFDELLRCYPDWQRSQRPGQSALADARPWITFGAIRALDEIVRADMRIFEFGSGGSTLFFADRARSGVSVEHDPRWGERVQQALAARGKTSWVVEVHEPVADPRAASRSPGDVDGYVSEGREYAGRSFHAYASSIDRFEDGAFDLVLLDGRARPSCFKHALPKVKTGGYLVLDNADRPYYSVIHETLATADWERRNFEGPGPYSWGFWATTVWRKLR